VWIIGCHSSVDSLKDKGGEASLSLSQVYLLLHIAIRKSLSKMGISEISFSLSIAYISSAALFRTSFGVQAESIEY